MKDNKLIAEFMGIKPDYIDNLGEPNYSHPLLKRESPHLEYHSSWDWLMPAAKLCKERQIFGSQNLIDDIDNALISMEVDSLYKTVVEFIKFYNKNQQS